MILWLLLAQGGFAGFWGAGRLHPETSALVEDLRARTVSAEEVLTGATWMVGLFQGNTFLAFHWTGGAQHFEGSPAITLENTAWSFWVGGYLEINPYMSFAGGTGLGKVYPRIVVRTLPPDQYGDLFTGTALSIVESPRLFATLEGVVFLWAPSGGGMPPFAGVALAAGYVYDFQNPPWKHRYGGEVQGVPRYRFRGWYLQAGVALRTFPQGG